MGLVLALSLVAGCTSVGAALPVREAVRLPALAQTSVVVDADGDLLARVHGDEDREVVPLARVPAVLQHAVIAVEDRRFSQHRGVDVRAIARALRANGRAARISEGGSTLTQQLAKNALTGGERTLQRKLREAVLALRMERHLSKDEILERYLNTVYFGRGAHGVQTAARRYFGVDVEDVSLPQAALLAAVLQSPTRYDPTGAPEAARSRRDLVLGRMAAQGHVTAEAARAARGAPLGVVPRPSTPVRAQDFVAHLMAELRHDGAFAFLGATAAERSTRLEEGGLRIETTLDPRWQEAAEDAATLAPGTADGLRAAVVALDPATGAIRAMVGGARTGPGEDAGSRFNLATQARRQPGSAFKPLVLAAALARGRALDDVLAAPSHLTLPAAPGTAPWTVGNHDGTDFGGLTLRAATALSANVVFAQLIDEVGPQAVARLAEAAGVRRPLPPLPSLALGAVEVSPLELAAVQATFASGGVHRAPTPVARIRAADGTVLWQRSEHPGERVLDEGVAWLVTDALSDVVAYGTGVAADLHRPMAGKTGTSQGGADAWFAGYTPDLAAAVWVGFPEGRVPMVPPRTPTPVEGGTLPAEVFARFGAAALAAVPARGFPVPGSLVSAAVDTTRGCLAGPATPHEVVAERAYLPGTEPTTSCDALAAVRRDPSPDPVPDVVNLPVATARTVLRGAGFAVDVDEGCPDGTQACTGARTRPGTVWHQVPDPGGEAAPGARVRLASYPT